jgi:hypothetical protein
MVIRGRNMQYTIKPKVYSFISSSYASQRVVGSKVYGNDHVVSIKCGTFLKHLSSFDSQKVVRLLPVSKHGVITPSNWVRVLTLATICMLLHSKIGWDRMSWRLLSISLSLTR